MVNLTNGPSPAVTEIRPRRDYVLWVWGLIAILAFVSIIRWMANNPAVDWSTVGRFMFAQPILQGLLYTCVIALIAEALGLFFGTLVALGREYGNPVISTVCWFFTWFFRSVPLLVQILVIGNFGLFLPHLSIGIPFTDITFVSWDTNAVMTAFVASIVALTLHETAYVAEIVRGGLASVNKGQIESGRSFGMTTPQIVRYIVLPQALRVIVPPLGSQFINVLKSTSLVSVIAGGDLLTVAMNISSVSLKTMELLFVASIWYLIVTSVASVVQTYMEKRLAVATSVSAAPRKAEA
jgi:polar amino acid transport system permease protein